MKDCFVYIEYNNLLPVFYYESDHLGSASYVTNDNGQVTQTLNYLPYGEDLVDLQNFSEMPTEYNLGVYQFNGKEKDDETGYNYYGARYYDSEKIGWLSVDPMSDKYPSLSPYVYCADNPVILVDPDGNNIDDYYYNEQGNIVKHITNNKPDRFFVEDDNEDIVKTPSAVKHKQINLDSDIGLLGRIIFVEAGGENQTSKESVGEVVKNRVESSKYPNTYRGVIEQKSKKNIYQFSSAKSGNPSNWRYNKPLSTKNQKEKTQFANSIGVAIEVKNGYSNRTDGSLYYYSPKSMQPKGSRPNCDFSSLKEVNVDGVNSNSFKFYKDKHDKK